MDLKLRLLSQIVTAHVIVLHLHLNRSKSHRMLFMAIRSIQQDLVKTYL